VGIIGRKKTEPLKEESKKKPHDENVKRHQGGGGKGEQKNVEKDKNLYKRRHLGGFKQSEIHCKQRMTSMNYAQKGTQDSGELGEFFKTKKETYLYEKKKKRAVGCRHDLG